MNAWPFVAAAYLVTITLTGALLTFSFVAMRRAESAAEALKRQ